MDSIRMPELEHFLLRQYARRNSVKKGETDVAVGEMFDMLLETKFDMNSVGTGGPLFCLLVDMRTILSIRVIIKMVEGGLDFGHVHMQGVAHRKLIRELEVGYSDTLWGVFVYVCQHTNFVETFPDIFDILYGQFTISQTGVFSEYEPGVHTVKMLLAYDKGHLIKRELLERKNFSLKECIKQRYPEVVNLILNS